MNSLSQFQIPDLWEVKDVINKVRNVVLNYTEMEAKVHEATNNEPWGASSTLMQEIAQGTFNYQYFNEIMPTLFKRFTEKEAKQWRQIYKALVLLEYLVKNGAERVIDEARSHMATIKILRNFHYIDEKGKDQGINVRNRAKELAELLSDVEKIKAERKKAKHNRNKYTAVSSSSGGGGGYSGGGSSSRYGGFGSDSGYTAGGSGNGGFSAGGGYSGSGGFGGGFDDDFSDSYDKGKYDDDGSFEDDDSSDKSKTKTANSDTNSAVSPKPAKQPVKEVNLFDFDEPTTSHTSTQPTSNVADDDEWGTFSSGGVANDDFDDFQSAAPISSTNTFTAPSAASSKVAAPSKPAQSNDLFDLLGDDSFAPAPSNVSAAPATMNAQNMSSMAPMGQHVTANNPSSPPATTAGKSNDLWSQASSLVSLDSLGKGNNQNKPTVGPSMNSLKSSATASEWSSWANASSKPPMNNFGSFTSQPAQQQQTKPSTNAFDDLLL